MADDGTSNPTDNRPFDDILQARLGRRAVLGGSLATAALTFFGASPALAKGKPAGTPGRGPAAGSGLGFQAIPLSTAKDDVAVAAGHTAVPFLPWGTPILPDAAATTYPISAADQEKKIGLGHDGMWFFPTNKDATHGVLCINMEYGTNQHILNGLAAEDVAMAEDSLEFVQLSQAVHGVAVVEIRRVGGQWQVVMAGRNRRITPNTAVEFSGPVAGSPLLENAAGNPFAGTVNNCANGKTPWGTYLTCEENFNGYFGAKTAWTRTAKQARYGFSASGFGYGWHLWDDRFDLSNPAYANEHNRFGWVVEIDPMDPEAKPVKRTALGRFKHENAELVEGRGQRVVVYMGDDERFDYVYKFVSDGNWKSMRARGLSPLDHGTLYVARFGDDGSGEWLPLSVDNPALQGGFTGLDDILVNARAAADVLGATKMDRPEWAAADPKTGDVYITMTNNTNRTAAQTDAPNSRGPNPWGHIVKIVDTDQHVGTTFRWDIFVLSGPSGQDGSTTDPNSEHGSPDGLAFAADGTMIIQTDGTQPKVGDVAANDQMLLADPTTGEIKRFFNGVKGCEVTGWTPLSAGTQLVNLQHPGDGDPNISSWPVEDGAPVPRDACVIITKVG